MLEGGIIPPLDSPGVPAIHAVVQFVEGHFIPHGRAKLIKRTILSVQRGHILSTVTRAPTR